MKAILLAALLVCLAAVWLLFTDQADSDIVEYRRNEAFVMYCEYVFRQDYHTPPARCRAIEAWARDVDPSVIDEVNVRAWVREMQSRPKIKERMAKR